MHGNTSKARLIGHKRPELIESPVVMSGSLLAPNPCPLTYTPQVFQANPARGAFRNPDQGLADAVVHIPLEAGQPPRQPLEPPLGALRADRLKHRPAAFIPHSSPFNRTAAEGLPIGGRRQVGLGRSGAAPVLHAQPPLDRNLLRLLHFADLMEVESATPIHQISLSPPLLQQFKLPFPADERHAQSPSRAPDRDRLLLVRAPRENPLIVGDAAVRLERALGLSVELVGVGNLRDLSHHHLRRQGEHLARLVIDQLVEVVLPKRLGFPSPLTDVVARGIGRFQRLLEGFGLLWCNKKLDLRDQSHGSYVIAHTFYIVKYRDRSRISGYHDRRVSVPAFGGPAFLPGASSVLSRALSLTKGLTKGAGVSGRRFS